MKNQLRRLVTEIHRRSLWQVLTLYVGGSWAVLEVVDHVSGRVHLPEWTYAMAFVLLLVGLPIVLATAFVQEGAPGLREEAAPRFAGSLLTWRRVIAGVMMAFAAWGVLAAGWLVVGGRAGEDGPSELDPDAVVVLPFAVRGGPRVAYLREGLVDLLSRTLDGAGSLRAIDPNAVLAYAGGNGTAPLSPERAEDVAAHFGAGVHLLGSLVEVGGGLEASVSVYDAVGGRTTSARARAEGEDEIHSMVDELAREILAELGSGSEARLARLAARTTHSVPALKAYLEGERLYRGMEFAAALEAFRRAVEADSTFALGHYRLALSAIWNADDMDLAREAAGRATRHSDRLSERDGLLLEALRLFLEGDVQAAIRRYRGLVGTYPDDMEAWFWLGDLYFHANPLFGRSAARAREPFERVLASNPGRIDAGWHLAQIAAFEGDRVQADTLARNFADAASGPAIALGTRTFAAMMRDDSAALDSLEEELATGGDLALFAATWLPAVGPSDLDGTRRFANLWVEPGRLDEVRASGHASLAQMELAEGRHQEAIRHLIEAGAADGATGLVGRVMLATHPYMEAPGPELRWLLEEVEEWDPSRVPERLSSPFFLPPAEEYPPLKPYLLGLLKAALGDGEGARAQADALDGMEGSTHAPSLPRDLALAVRAEMARREGRPEEALRFLQAMPRRISFVYVYSSQVHGLRRERFLTATLLEDLGRDSEALGWLDSMGELGFHDYPYLVPAALVAGRIHERSGDVEAAARRYARVTELLEDADAAAEPWLREATARLEELGRPRG